MTWFLVIAAGRRVGRILATRDQLRAALGHVSFDGELCYVLKRP